MNHEAVVGWHSHQIINPDALTTIRAWTAKSEYFERVSAGGEDINNRPSSYRVREKVEINPGGTDVCVNVDYINDSKTTSRILTMVADAVESLGECYGVVYFGTDLTFNNSPVLEPISQ